MTWEVPGNSAGPMNGDGSYKLLLHDTEGWSIEDAIASYRANNSWPTLTVDASSARGRRVCRHLPDTVAARSLRNTEGGADQTNKDGTVHIQIELVGFANNRDGSMFATDDDYRWFGAEVVGPRCRANGIPISSTVDWVAYPDSGGADAPQRLSPAQWDAYSGILAHQHAPDNTHGDTGLIRIDLILSAALGAPPAIAHLLEDDEMTLVRNKANGHTFVCCGGKLVNVTGESNVQSARNGGVPVWEVEPDEYDRLIHHLGPVLT